MKIVKETKVSVQTREQDVKRIVDAACAIDPLNHGLYDRTVLSHTRCTGIFEPHEGSTTHLHLGSTDLQVGPCLELEFVLDEATDLEAVLNTIIEMHHYEESVIHIASVQTTRADYNPESENKNRWWHETKA